MVSSLSKAPAKRAPNPIRVSQRVGPTLPASGRAAPVATGEAVGVAVGLAVGVAVGLAVGLGVGVAWAKRVGVGVGAVVAEGVASIEGNSDSPAAKTIKVRLTVCC